MPGAGAAVPAAASAAAAWPVSSVLATTRRQIPVQHVGRNLLQFARSLAGDAGQHFVRQQRTQQVPGANLRSAELDRGDHPGLADQVHDLRRQARRPGVARLQAVDGRRQRANHPGRVDLEMPQQRGEVRIVSLQQLEQPVLKLHVVIGPRQTQARRAPPASGGRSRSAWRPAISD